MARRCPTDLTKILAMWEPSTRSVGRPQEGWLWNQHIKRKLGENGLRWETEAANRAKWKTMGAKWAEDEDKRRRTKRRRMVRME